MHIKTFQVFFGMKLNGLYSRARGFIPVVPMPVNTFCRPSMRTETICFAVITRCVDGLKNFDAVAHLPHCKPTRLQLKPKHIVVNQ
jgi:hypothetical protein